MSGLPGRYQKIAANWFSLHPSFNKEIQYLLDDDAAGLKVNERLAAYNLLQKNIISSTKLKEKAVKLRNKASILTKIDRVSIAAEQDRLAWKSMVTYEINERERKRNQNR
ncbi:hypothetical protein CE557_124 [Cardinium endosymbiont of Sogatella furcifera]|uniref:hypothetical protein n=1 Tax=Cardinium endosymbiont of Sogatella furcifera TaxID=650378 RepID=UPI000E0CDF1B|nr:hypothetical protein [Cardinium endosymbiont of Sogatella furcifera]AXI23963.1 hypothetical protein CE557_124 [Cardinium endosymbiont of Sogatella furcifera]